VVSGICPLTSNLSLLDSGMLLMVEAHSPPILVCESLAGRG
jgi:hypothetical protein